MKYQSFIGLEVHIHLLTQTKVFCGCEASFGGEPNTHVCPVCLGYPGVLPALNIEAMRMGCIVARALNCSIPERTWFERKQYFYPDMPKNYQISQFASPLGQNGFMMLGDKKVRIKECHLEEDAGKMIHTGTVSLLDYNRAGVSLLEIVTEPDMESGEEAELFIRRLRRMVRYLGVCDGNMEEGSLRADANVSINTPGAGLGRKVEIKNLNSSRFVRLALNHEIGRQALRLDEGKKIVQETRLWNENRDQTEPMRQKENAQDYRYFPEPDLPVFTPDAAFLKSVAEGLVELPQARIERIAGEYGLNEEQADAVVDEKAGADYFEAAVNEAVKRGLEKKAAAKTVYNWFSSDIKAMLNRSGLGLSDLGGIKLNPERLASIITMLDKGRISGKTARLCAEIVLNEGLEPEDIVAKNGWEKITDPGLIQGWVERVLADEAGTVSDLQALKTANPKRAAALRAYLLGKVIAASQGRADPKLAGDMLDAAL